jgi:hypothetical protein
MKRGKRPVENYCGCCGRPADDPFWCTDCKTHLRDAQWGWDRTWSAQHGGEDCPYKPTNAVTNPKKKRRPIP